jgi:hypothetical protein
VQNAAVKRALISDCPVQDQMCYVLKRLYDHVRGDQKYLTGTALRRVADALQRPGVVKVASTAGAWSLKDDRDRVHNLLVRGCAGPNGGFCKSGSGKVFALNERWCALRDAQRAKAARKAARMASATR